MQTLLHYPYPPHLQDGVPNLGLTEGTLPISEAIHRECLSLPMGRHIDDRQADAVIEAVRSFAS